MADKTKRVDGEDLPASAFLIMGDPEDLSTWKLPWKFSTDDKTKAHIRNAIARFNQLTDVSDADKKTAWAKLMRVAKEYGIDAAGNDKAFGAQLKACRFDLKAIGDDGSFSGYAAVFGNVDQGGDVILPGAFAKSLKERGSQIPIKWEHDQMVGLGMAAETDRGLRVDGLFNLKTASGQEAYGNAKFCADNGHMLGMSIGYLPVWDKTSFKGDSRMLGECKLFEATITATPMNEMARLTSVKSGDANTEFVESLKAFACERKAGRTISDATKQRLMAAATAIEMAAEEIEALIGMAEDPTAEAAEAAASAAEKRIEPDLHSFLAVVEERNKARA